MNAIWDALLQELARVSQVVGRLSRELEEIAQMKRDREKNLRAAGARLRALRMTLATYAADPQLSVQDRERITAEMDRLAAGEPADDSEDEALWRQVVVLAPPDWLRARGEG